LSLEASIAGVEQMVLPEAERKVYVVWNNKGGVGKSTIVFNDLKDATYEVYNQKIALDKKRIKTCSDSVDTIVSKL